MRPNESRSPNYVMLGEVSLWRISRKVVCDGLRRNLYSVHGSFRESGLTLNGGFRVSMNSEKATLGTYPSYASWG